ncbi:hypothetical protein [Enterovibrio paralichthyis]|uniref:hypothetical protein n=1 Tax=Enterovibrio paralichthyis TaxID=2853805 RepID=UPI001C4460B7|nr:hypothetical protein [Enterovibrio paralichthyis]MBV7298151.1 hypothetical protein [Enterovibrio paralichthyis]
MSVFNYCRIDEFQISDRMRRYINQIDNAQTVADHLALVMSAHPMVKLFSGRMSSGSRLKAIAEHDWEEFGQAMRAVPRIARTKINNIATEAAIFSNGEEAKFWRCVSAATR